MSSKAGKEGKTMEQKGTADPSAIITKPINKTKEECVTVVQVFYQKWSLVH